MALRERENTGNWKRKHYIALVENSLLKKTYDKTDLVMNEWMNEWMNEEQPRIKWL